MSWVLNCFARIFYSILMAFSVSHAYPLNLFLARIPYASSVHSLRLGTFTRKSVKGLCWLIFHLHLLFQVSGFELFHAYLHHMFMLARVLIRIFRAKFWTWKGFTRISNKNLSWQKFHMYLLFKFLVLELFHTYHLQMFMLAIVSYASSVQRLRLQTF